MINENEIAPDININTDLNEFSLQDQRGKKIVIFFFHELILLVAPQRQLPSVN